MVAWRWVDAQLLQTEAELARQQLLSQTEEYDEVGLAHWTCPQPAVCSALLQPPR